MINISKIVKSWENRNGWYISPGLAWCEKGDRVRIGNHVFMGDDVKISDGVDIGHYVRIGDGAVIGSFVMINIAACIGDNTVISDGDQIPMGKHTKVRCR